MSTVPSHAPAASAAGTGNAAAKLKSIAKTNTSAENLRDFSLFISETTFQATASLHNEAVFFKEEHRFKPIYTRRLPVSFSKFVTVVPFGDNLCEFL
jgi:hypothetical protein